jgi:peptidoglycan/LPS O-acetylase OafA/YrhL
MKSLSRFQRVWIVGFCLLLTLTAFQAVTGLTPATEQAIILLVSLIAGFFPGMNLINAIKEKLQVEDEVALLLVYAICGGIGALGLLLSGQLFEIEWSWMNVASIAGVFLAGAKFAYQRLKTRSS